jgi:hypothetical protein
VGQRPDFYLLRQPQRHDRCALAPWRPCPLARESQCGGVPIWLSLDYWEVCGSLSKSYWVAPICIAQHVAAHHSTGSN